MQTAYYSGILLRLGAILLLMGHYGKTASLEPDTQYGPPGNTPGEPLRLDQLTTEAIVNGGGSGYGEYNDEKVAVCKNTDLERNKQLIMDFYQTSLREKRADLMDQFLAEDYLNHSPYSEEPTRADFQRILTTGPLGPQPSQTVKFYRVDAIEDRVWVHCSFDLNGRKFAVMDIWTINCDGLMQEHWDVLQDTTSVKSKNPVPFFSKEWYRLFLELT